MGDDLLRHRRDTKSTKPAAYHGIHSNCIINLRYGPCLCFIFPHRLLGSVGLGAPTIAYLFYAGPMKKAHRGDRGHKLEHGVEPPEAPKGQNERLSKDEASKEKGEEVSTTPIEKDKVS